MGCIYALTKFNISCIDFGGSTANEDTLYQRYHTLTKLVEKV